MVVPPPSASRSTQVRTRKWVLASAGGAEQLEDVALAVADVDAPGRVAQQLRGLPEVLQPADALLLLDRDAGGVDLPLQGVGPLELLAGPELDGRQAERDAPGGEDEAGVHQQPAEGDGGVPGLEERELADRLGVVAGEAELGRVVQDEDRAGGRGEAGPGGREMPGEDDPLVDPGVAEEAVGRLGGGPVLAGRRQGAADPPSQVAEELAQAAPSAAGRGSSPSPSSRSTQASMAAAPVRSDVLGHASSRA